MAMSKKGAHVEQGRCEPKAVDIGSVSIVSTQFCNRCSILCMFYLILGMFKALKVI